jgi:hypothetical protein
MAEVIKLVPPNRLDQLADTIKKCVVNRNKAQDDWVTATLELCIAFAEARLEFTSDQQFGMWVMAHDEFKLNHQDRAAAIQMGMDPELTKAVLVKTERRSLQLIHKYEFKPEATVRNMIAERSGDKRFTSASKPPSYVTNSPYDAVKKATEAAAARIADEEVIVPEEEEPIDIEKEVLTVDGRPKELEEVIVNALKQLKLATLAAKRAFTTRKNAKEILDSTRINPEQYPEEVLQELRVIESYCRQILSLK